ncbi:TetR/AcrR family transcriptional regulator [Paenibacillus psychroresistens]|uniref:TetR/AcrR family transcriptional regulator n=1 Tax=Paenibacillus psychroresistens TaxID=1778678 RepID=A0A6B8RFD8_9BACL|nr:TetR/AcrR family transcriptional regulator [Paenibacillus psychroresistens]QGQ94202.1 TetR/AcrR family transcriptional regulator [Paenibacillus psychroresistens]
MSRQKAFEINEAIDKAIDIFWDKGFEGTSMQDIVEALGLSRSSIYETFGSKKELFLVALDRYEDKGSITAKAILYNKEGTAKDILLRYFNQIIEDTQFRSCLMINSSLEMTHHPDVKARVLSSMTESEEGFYQLLIRAEANGELKGNPNIRYLAQHLVNVRNGITVSTLSFDRQVLDNIVNMSLSFLG